MLQAESSGGGRTTSRLESPAIEAGTGGIARAHGCVENEITLFQAALADGVAGRERNGSGGGVAVFIDVDENAIQRDTQALGRGYHDAAVCLMRDEDRHIIRVEMISLEQRFAKLGNLLHGVLEHLLAILFHVVQAIGNRFRRGGHAASPSGHFEIIAAGTVDLANEIDVAGVFVLQSRFDEERSGTVSEQDAGGTVCVIDDAAHGVGADHQDLLVGTACDKMRAGVQAVQESGAGCNQVKPPGVAGANTILNQAGCCGKHHVRRYGAYQNGVQVRRGYAALTKSGTRGFYRHVGRSDVWSGDVPLFYARPFHNPLVVRLDHFLEIGIGEHPGRRIATEGSDFGSKRAQFP